MRTVTTGRTHLLILLLLCVGMPTGVEAACHWEGKGGAGQPLTAMAFGNYSVFSGTALTATDGAAGGPIKVKCDPGFTATMTIDKGSGTVPQRKMVKGPDTANYNLYLDAGGGQIWGDGTTGTPLSIGDGVTFSGFIYGIVPAAQDLVPGNYTDTVNAKVSGTWGQDPNVVAITITMTVNIGCRVDNFTLNFGIYNPLSATALAQSTNLNVYCTKTTPATFTMSNGVYWLTGQRRMFSAARGTYLNYNLSIPTTAGTSTSCLTPIAGGFPLNGTVPALQDQPVGSYIDTLVATITY